MLFNSGVFLKFFGAFLLLYWLVRNHLQARNILLVVASYVFYGWWDYRFLALIIASSMIDYVAGRALSGTEKQKSRKRILFAALSGNLIILGFFKYYDFFIDSAAALLTQWNIPFHPRTLGIILPVGISFYTFQTMSYSIDVYRREIPATRNLLNFFAYVSFFPQLVAGPIERARHLLPQFQKTQTITRPMLEEGIWLMLWGMSKKVVLADNLAPLVDMVYQSPAYSGPMVVLATVAFGLQIYCDFSGYSDIARGAALVLGFDIMMNFNLPYSAKSPREFWKRWHISLSSWLRDYLYIPLGGNRCGKVRNYFNLLTTMLLGGLWHGAAWNFALWGAWHGSGLVAQRLNPFTAKKHTAEEVLVGAVAETRRRSDSSPALAREGSNTESKCVYTQALSWVVTMLFVLYGWLLFRAKSFEQIFAMTGSLKNWTTPLWFGSYVTCLLIFASPLVLMEIYQARRGGYRATLAWPAWGRALLQGLLLVAVILFWQKEEVPFIYFQF